MDKFMIKASVRAEDVPLDEIAFNEDNDYSQDNVDALAESIRQNGLLHNIVLSNRDGDLVLLAGEQRVRAYRKLHEEDPGSWDTIRAVIYTGLTPRQEQIIVDASNLQTRAAGSNEVQLRKAMVRYIANVKEEFGLNDGEAISAAAESSGVSEQTVKKNIKLAEKLNDGFSDKLNDGEITKGDAMILTDMDQDEQDDLLGQMDDADSDDEAHEILQTAIQQTKDKKAQQRQSKKTKAAPAKQKLDDDEEDSTPNLNPEDQEFPVTQSSIPPRQLQRIGYLDKLKAIRDTIKEFNTPDIVAQIARLDAAADEDNAETVRLYLDMIVAEASGLKRAIKESDGEFDAGIDPVYGHRRGNKGEEGYVED